jgi:hypothetical protein
MDRWRLGRPTARPHASAGAVIAALWIGLHAAPVLGAETAKAGLSPSNAAAQKWQADAVLTHVSTLAGRTDGKADSWLYTYYSPKAKKSAIVTAQGGKVELEEVLRNTSVDPIAADFLDSDKALDAAAKAGLSIDKAAKDVMLGLTVGGQAVGKPQLFWAVTLNTPTGFTSVTLNGKDGALIKRDEIKLK